MLLACMASMAAHAAGQTYAWLEDESQETLVRVVRGNQTHGYDPATGFLACDQVSLTSAASGTIAIATTDGARLLLGDRIRSVKLPCSSRTGVARDVAMFLQALLRKSNMRIPVVAATRGAAGKCALHDLDMPFLSSGENIPTMLTSDSSPLVLAWTGTAGPFTIQIDSPDGSAMLRAAAIEANVYRAEVKSLPRGHYQLHLSDSCHGELEDDYLKVVAPAERPPVPPQIADLPEPGRTIFYADYLLGLGDGRWGLEALQLVARLPDTDPEARAWIRQWTQPR
jgi:hypothetical protein